MKKAYELLLICLLEVAVYVVRLDGELDIYITDNSL